MSLVLWMVTEMKNSFGNTVLLNLSVSLAACLYSGRASCPGAHFSCRLRKCWQCWQCWQSPALAVRLRAGSWRQNGALCSPRVPAAQQCPVLARAVARSQQCAAGFVLLFGSGAGPRKSAVRALGCRALRKAEFCHPKLYRAALRLGACCGLQCQNFRICS